MILKILARHSPTHKALLHYILKKDSIPILHNVRSSTLADWTKEYIRNEALRKHPRKGQVYFTHEIISFSNQDTGKITNEMLEDIARKYIELRGVTGLYVGAAHHDREHIHLHFCVSGTQAATGRAMRMSWKEMKALKIELQEYHIQKYPELEKSICNHGKSKESQKAKIQQIKESRISLEAYMKKIVSECFEKAVSQRHFIDLLRDAGLYHYERTAGELTGIIRGATKVRFSRIGITPEHLRSLPIDRTEEHNVLKEIEALRRSQRERSFGKQINIREK